MAIPKAVAFTFRWYSEDTSGVENTVTKPTVKIYIDGVESVINPSRVLHGGGGYWYVALTSLEMTGDSIGIKATSGSLRTYATTVYPDSMIKPVYDGMQTLTSGGGLDAMTFFPFKTADNSFPISLANHVYEIADLEGNKGTISVMSGTWFKTKGAEPTREEGGWRKIEAEEQIKVSFESKCWVWSEIPGSVAYCIEGSA